MDIQLKLWENHGDFINYEVSGDYNGILEVQFDDGEFNGKMYFMKKLDNGEYGEYFEKVIDDVFFNKACDLLLLGDKYIRGRLPISDWENIFRNLNDLGEEVEVLYLDNTDSPFEWGLASGEELFERGFYSEAHAEGRLIYLENKLLWK